MDRDLRSVQLSSRKQLVWVRVASDYEVKFNMFLVCLESG